MSDRKEGTTYHRFLYMTACEYLSALTVSDHCIQTVVVQDATQIDVFIWNQLYISN